MLSDGSVQCGTAMAANAHPPSWPAGSGPLVHAGAVVDGHYIVVSTCSAVPYEYIMKFMGICLENKGLKP